MQQSMSQDQIGPPQPQMVQMTPQGQMVYCPVRLLYDSPVIMQPEQIQQPNQNVFVNQPPWARPVQNQVIYVQQVGPGLVQMQQIDPNLYLQQNAYQGMQMIQNIPQGQLRPVLGNVQQNFAPNFVQTVSIDQATGQIVPNYGFMQTNTDVNNSNNVVNVANNEENKAANQVQQNVANQEVQTQIYRQMTQQMHPQQNLVRHQIPIMNQLQNMPTMQVLPQVLNSAPMNQNVNNVAQISQNVTNVAQVPQNVVSSAPQNIPNNIRPNVPVNMVHSPLNVVQVTANNKINSNVNTSVNTSASLSNIANTMRPGVEANMVRNVAQNMAQIRQTVGTQSAGTPPRSIPPNTSVPIEKNMNNTPNMNTVLYSAVRNGQPYTYRAIQPKPNMNVRVNFLPRPNQPQIVRKPIAPNMSHSNVSKMETSHAGTNTPNLTNMLVRPTVVNGPMIPPNNIKSEVDANVVNRKRKSESPDEVQKKISNYGSITVTAQVKDRIKAKYGQGTSEIGVNTSPVHKPRIKLENQSPMLQINPMETKSKEDLSRATENGAKSIHSTTNIVRTSGNQAIIALDDKKDVSLQTEAQALVRKTVFPQARGRLLNDKVNLTDKLDKPSAEVAMDTTESIPKSAEQVPSEVPNKNEIITSKINTNENNIPSKSLPNLLEITPNKIINTTNEVSQNTSNNKELLKELNKNEDRPIQLPQQTITTQEPTTSDMKTNDILDTESDRLVIDTDAIDAANSIDSKDKSDTEVKKEDPVDSFINEVNVEKPKIKQTDETEKCKETTETPDLIEETKEVKVEKKEYKNISASEMTGKEIHIVDGNIQKKERDYILTHVLDGYVIQESNVPFAIRKPLKEKTINAVVEMKHENSSKNFTKDEMKEKILELSQLHLEENKGNVQNKTDQETSEEIVIEETCEKMEEEVNVATEKGNPFCDLKQSIVKSWTVEELANHLAKLNWTQTVSLLQEHEIDGESLFLVTKSQLLTIGINEDHADVICAFVQKT